MPSLSERARTRLLVAGVLAVVTAALLLRNLFLFRTPIYENGDQAANSILVNQAAHFTLLVGNYSRLRFNHPGPAFLYVQAAGQQILYSALHAVPARYNGQVLAVVALNAVLLALVALVVRRRLGSVVWGGAFVLACLAVTASELRWAFTWMPYMYAAPFLLALVAGASVATGALGDLPIFVLAGGLLVHGHVAFIPMFGAFFVLVSIAFFVQSRKRLRELIRAERVALAVSGGLAVLFLLPIVLELALHWPGPWARYWEYSTSAAHSQTHPMFAVLGFVAHFWTTHSWSRALLAFSAAAGAVLAATERDRDRRRFLASLLACSAVLTVLFAAYVARGVDSLARSDDYVGFFYYTVPAAVAATAVVAALLRLAGALRAAAGRRRWLVPAGAVVASVAAIACAGFVIASSSFTSPFKGEPAMPRLASIVAAHRPAGAPTVVVDLPSTAPLAAGWPGVTGLIVSASRQDYRVCVADPWWTFMMSSQYICTPADERGALHVMVLTGGTPAPSGWSLLATDRTTTLLYRPPR